MGGSLWFDGPGGWLFTDFRVVNLMATGFPQSGSINQQSWAYPLVNIQKAIEHGPFIVDFPIKHGGSFHGYVKLPEGTSWEYHGI